MSQSIVRVRDGELWFLGNMASCMSLINKKELKREVGEEMTV